MTSPTKKTGNIEVRSPPSRESAGAKAAISVVGGVLVAFLYFRGADLAVSATVVGFLGWVLTALTDYFSQKPSWFQGRDWGLAFYHASRWLLFGGVVCLASIGGFGMAVLLLRPEEVSAREAFVAGGSGAGVVLVGMATLAWKRKVVRYAEARMGLFVGALRSIQDMLSSSSSASFEAATSKALKWLVAAVQLDPYSHLFNRIGGILGLREVVHARLFRADPRKKKVRVVASAYSIWLPDATREVLKRQDERQQLSRPGKQVPNSSRVGKIIFSIADSRRTLISKSAKEVLWESPLKDSRVWRPGRISAFVGCPIETGEGDTAVLLVSSNVRLIFDWNRVELCLGFAEILRYIYMQQSKKTTLML